MQFSVSPNKPEIAKVEDVMPTLIRFRRKKRDFSMKEFLFRLKGPNFNRNRPKKRKNLPTSGAPDYKPTLIRPPKKLPYASLTVTDEPKFLHDESRYKIKCMVRTCS